MGQVVSDVADAAISLPNPNSWTQRKPDEDLRLPSTVDSLISLMKEGLLFDVLTGNLSYKDLPDFKKQLVKYSGSSLKHGRPLNTVMIVMAGQTGKGKSTTIQRFFDSKIFNPDTDRTRWISEYSKEIRATAECPAIIGTLKFVDVPGALDEDPEKNVENFARFKLFGSEHPDLAKRSPVPELEKRNVTVRKEVYPNLILFVASSTDKIMPLQSRFRKSAAYIKASQMVDTLFRNLIVVITHAMEFDNLFSMKCEAMRRDIQSIVWKALHIPSVPVLFIENKYESFKGEIEGDFFILPNGERNYANLKIAMEEVFKKNHDNLGRQLISHYFHPKCPEKANDFFNSNTDFFELNPTANNLVEARSVLKALGVYTGADLTLKETKLSLLGRGYCPKTENLMSSNVFNKNSECKVKLVMDKRILIPKNIHVTPKSETISERLSFSSKEEYERHRKQKYGFSVGIHLVVSENLSSSWGSDIKISNSKELIKFAYYIYLAKFELLNPEEQISEKLLNDIKSLPSTYNKEESQFLLFFEKHGTHLIKALHIGGSLNVECHIEGSSLASSDILTFEKKLELLLNKKINCAVNGKISSENLADMISKLSFSKVQFNGGRGSYEFISLGELTEKKLLEWVDSVKQMDIVTEIPDSVELEPYYNFSDTTEKKIALRTATMAYLERNDGKKKSYATKENMSKEHSAAGKRQAERNAESNASCFPESTMVSTANRGVIKICNLRYGDLLYGEHWNCSKFYTFLHFEEKQNAEFLVIHMEDGEHLKITRDHLIFRCANSRRGCTTVPAGLIEPGDYLLQAVLNGDFKRVRVTSIGVSRQIGFYCPLVENGTFLANGILVSCYASVKSQTIAHLSMAPLRIWYEMRQKRNLSELYKATSFTDGIHSYAKLLIKIRKIANWFGVKD